MTFIYRFDQFIPPFSNTGSTVNSNLNVSGKFPPEAPGQHGFSPFHSEQEEIIFHHNNQTSLSLVGQGSGFFEDVVTSGFGMPWKNEQGVELLWNTFFSEMYPITETEWNSEANFYHYLFGSYLTTFIERFLPNMNNILSLNIPIIQQAVKDNDQQILKRLSALYEFLPNILGLLSSDDTRAALLAIKTRADQYNTLGTNDGLQKWFLGTQSGDPTALFTDNMASNSNLPLFPTDLGINKDLSYPTTDGAQWVGFLWKTYLRTSDIELRDRAPIEWAFSVMSVMLQTLTQITEQQANRVTPLTKAQQAATTAIAKVTFDLNTNFDDQNAQTAAQAVNQKAQANIQLYQSYRSLAENYTQAQTSAASNSQSQMQSQSSIMSDLLQNLDGIIQGIFR